MKVCNHCGSAKPATSEYFHRKKANKDGLQLSCKTCVSKYRKKYYKTNKETETSQVLAYIEENLDEIKEYKKEYYESNKEVYLKRHREYYEYNKEEILHQRKEYRDSNKDKIKEYYETNKKKIIEQKKYYLRYKRKTDPYFRLVQNLRNRVGSAIKNNYKSMSTLELLGCSIEEVKEHLEKQFKEGMTWENYGKWHVDHIRPISSFDLTDVEQQKVCFHYSNLQPLWAEENLRKSNKYKLASK